MTKEEIHESATDKQIGALLYQNSLVAEINKWKGQDLTLADILKAVEKASQHTQWEIGDRERKLIKAFFPDAELKRDESLITA